MPQEPAVKRTVAFVDGQNLYHATREAFGYTYPNYHVRRLAHSICATEGWELAGARFYTGMPDRSDDARWHHFWMSKLRAMS